MLLINASSIIGEDESSIIPLIFLSSTRILEAEVLMPIFSISVALPFVMVHTLVELPVFVFPK